MPPHQNAPGVSSQTHGDRKQAFGAGFRAATHTATRGDTGVSPRRFTFSVLRQRHLWFTLSGLTLFASVGVLLVWGIRPGIDFVGGSALELAGTDVTVPRVRQALLDRNITSPIVQTTGEGTVLVRLPELSPDAHASLLRELREVFPDIDERQFTSVGPTISRELLGKAILALILATLGILLYLAIAFRGASTVVSPWVFGVIAVLVLLHDVLIASGFFAVYARFRGASADSLFVTALLTTLGFSVHDTIVIFNRIRANLRTLSLSFRDLVDVSVLETMTRSVNTSVTTLLVLVALVIFGSVTIRPFLLTLSVGIVVGSYSSIFITAPLIVLWQERRGRPRHR